MIELSFEEVERHITEICTGEKLVYVKNSAGIEVPLILKHPSTKDKMYSEYVHKQALADAEKQGLPSTAEIETIIKQRGIFTDADEEEISSIERKIKGQEAVLAKTTRVPARRDRLVQVINEYKQQISAIRSKRDRALEITKERKAAEEKLLYLTWRGTYKAYDDERYWETLKEFEEETDIFFRMSVFVEYVVFSQGTKTEILRYIARNNMWRVRYSTSVKTSEKLLDRPIAEWTQDQLMLLYWSHFYQSIYDMLSSDKPSDDIIEDDSALDAFVTSWSEERNREAAAAKAKKQIKSGNNSAWDYGEVLVTKSNVMYQDITYSETLAESPKNKGATAIDAAPTKKQERRR